MHLNVGNILSTTLQALRKDVLVESDEFSSNSIQFAPRFHCHNSGVMQWSSDTVLFFRWERFFVSLTCLLYKHTVFLVASLNCVLFGRATIHHITPHHFKFVFAHSLLPARIRNYNYSIPGHAV